MMFQKTTTNIFSKDVKLIQIVNHGNTAKNPNTFGTTAKIKILPKEKNIQLQLKNANQERESTEFVHEINNLILNYNKFRGNRNQKLVNKYLNF